MKDYKVNGKVIEMTLESGKVVKCSTDWANKSMKALGTDMEDVLLMWLEDNDYLENEEQEELNSKAKANKVKITATSEKKVVKKTQIISDFLKKLDEETIEKVGLLILGVVFPAWSSEEIGIGGKLVERAVAEAVGTTQAAVEDAVPAAIDRIS